LKVSIEWTPLNKHGKITCKPMQDLSVVKFSRQILQQASRIQKELSHHCFLRKHRLITRPFKKYFMPAKTHTHVQKKEKNIYVSYYRNETA